jgi:hypothetical protein
MTRRPATLKEVREAHKATNGRFAATARVLGWTVEEVRAVLGVPERRRGRRPAALDRQAVVRAIEEAGSGRGAAVLLDVPEAVLRRYRKREGV